MTVSEDSTIPTPASVKPSVVPKPPSAASKAPTPAAPTSPSVPAGTPAAAATEASAAATQAAPAPSAAVETPSNSNAASFGRVDEDGTVYVRTPDGEKAVGSYPGKSADEALAYFARKYDELRAAAALLLQRVTQTDISAHDAGESLKTLRKQVTETNAVGDLPALDSIIEDIATALRVKQQVEGEARAAAKKEALAHREQLVAEAEQIAAQDPEKVQWKKSTTRMRELLDEWKNHQKNGARLDRDVESALWQRFSAARNGFDKTRRTHFSQLDEQHGAAKKEKERLVAEAEKLATSNDWGPTASAFKRLMSEWRQAGRASRSDDDALWQRFKKAQDAFFAAKDEVVAEENKVFEANAKVKEELLAEGQKILPVKDLGAAKAQLRALQEKWDAAGKVPRKDMDRIEKGMRRIENAVRDAEQAQWKKSDPEVSARANSMVTQLENAVASLRSDVEAAEAAGNSNKAAKLRQELEAKQSWLEQVRSTANELEG